MLHHYCAFTGLVVAIAAVPQYSRDTYNTTMASNFKDVPVSADLKYIPCFHNFTCANLEVPLDYENMTAGTTSIAFIKYMTPQQPALGDIILNPGGPGESGVDWFLDTLPTIASIVGDSHNIVGMDPRGVKNSGPNIDCFPHPAVRDVYIYKDLFGNLDRNEASLSRYYEAAGGFGEWCSQTIKEAARYVNTPATARDMLQYTEQLARSEGKNPSEALVNYFGVSYGSTLGSTFAALYPDRVGRFVIDGVVDVEDHYFGNWSQNILQADQAIEAFFGLCAEAGPLCALYGNGSTTAEQIKKRFDAILNAVEKDPVVVTDPSLVQYPVTLGYLDLSVTILLLTYNGQENFATLAEMFADLEQRNGTILELFAKSSQRGLVPLNIDNSTYDPIIPKIIIACNDNNHRFGKTKQDLLNLFSYNQKLSKYAGIIWTPTIIPQCRNLIITPPESQLFKGFKKTKTKTPILFTDNVIDPVSSSYYKMSSFFEGSTVLLQNAIGHGLGVSKSRCTNAYVSEYFSTAKLPPPKTICQTELKPFMVPQ